MPFKTLFIIIITLRSQKQGRQNLMGADDQKIYIVDGKRTPFGKFGGSLSHLKPIDLAVHATQSLLNGLNLNPEHIDQVLFANVLPCTADTLYIGRHLALKTGMKPETPGMTINRLCGSGIQAILDAKRLIQSREAQAILVSGAETMSMTPHLIYGARFGTRYGSFKNSDLLLDTLFDTHIQMSMGQTVEKLGEEFEISRLQADQFAFNSHQKANLAYEKGFIQPELVPISQDKMTLDKDEHLRSELSLIEMQKLRSTFKKDGLTTAASASGIVDGACAMVVANEEFILKNKLTPIAEIVQGQVVGVDPAKMGLGPVPAIEKLIRSRNMDVSEIDYFEINEAFAAQVLGCQKSLKIPDEKLNIWGGAIALGHPLGATGIKITLTLSRQLAIHKKKLGIASACIGGGQGIALLIKSP